MTMMNSEYLQREVGEVLGKALAATATAMPEDPVEFLAMWLVNHEEQKRVFVAFEADKAQLEAERRAEEEAHAEERRAAECAEQARQEAVRVAEERRLADIRAKIAPLEAALAAWPR
jgi:hypothetical protein